MNTATNIATETNHSFELTRDDDNGVEYQVWVNVAHYEAAECGGGLDPSFAAELEAFVWNDDGKPVELDDEDLADILDLIQGLN